MLYSLSRPLLFALDPETAHDLAFTVLDIAARTHTAGLIAHAAVSDPVRVMGIDFPNRVGLAAGLDKNAAHIDGLASLGFGFIECGTTTPRAQPGNPRPRLFRLPAAEALINRLGFNNDGVARFIENVERAKFRGVLGLNIGKNFDTPNERAIDDYLRCLEAVYAHAAYVTVNVSSPNTRGLRDLQSEAALTALLAHLKGAQARLADRHGRHVPLAIKIAPDLDDAAIEGVARVLVAGKADAAIATNTTVDRTAVANLRHGGETGGLSGRPLFGRSTEVLRKLAGALDGALPVIGVGGIFSGEDAVAKIEAGAALVQLYSGLIYRGPALVGEVAAALARHAGKRAP